MIVPLNSGLGLNNRLSFILLNVTETSVTIISLFFIPNSVKNRKQECSYLRIGGKETNMNQSDKPLLRQEYAFQCPRCRQYNLVKSDDQNVHFLCPDPACGYKIMAVPPVQASPHGENE